MKEENDGKGGATLCSLDIPTVTGAALILECAKFLGNALEVALNQGRWDIVAELRRVLDDAFEQVEKHRAEMEAEKSVASITN